MKQIGFKNFRRFENFPSIDLAPITIFVGENNAGKSTVVKGILALSDFLNRWRNDDVDFYIEERERKSEKKRKTALLNRLKNQKFYFNTSYLAHIGTFKRALFNRANEGIITFFTSLSYMDITIDVMGDRNDEESVSGIISNITITYTYIGLTASFDLQNDIARVLYVPIAPDKIDRGPFSKKKDEIIDFCNLYSDPIDFCFHISDYYRMFAPDLISALASSVEVAINATLDTKSTEKLVDTDLFGKLQPISDINEETIQFLKSYTEKICGSSVSRGDRWLFRLPGARLPMRMFNIEYLYAHAVTQTVIYSAKDTNDYLSRTIHEFASIPKSDDDYQRTFITQWMKEFGVGQDYLITSVGGEAHIVKIQNKDGEWVNLSDKGMGSIQLMVLLFRLAITLPKISFVGEDDRRKVMMRSRMSRIIIIEEPEQNLHPMLQSKLADLLFRLNEDYGYRFIIETHSEYLIRKTQVIVKENFNDEKRPLKENPFKVFYFNPSELEKPYYEIIYQKDGSFSNDFGKGFFDEASNLAFKIL